MKKKETETVIRVENNREQCLVTRDYLHAKFRPHIKFISKTR